MEQLIKTIIDVDKKARKMTDESKKQLAESKIAIAQRVEELDKKYEESVEEIRREWRDMAIWHYVNDIAAVSGAPEFVRALHTAGVRLALATASHAELFEPILKRHGMFDCFDFFATTEQVERGKGYPDIYLFAAQGIGAKPEECAVFEDIIEGVRAAKLGGFTVCARLNDHYKPDRDEIRKSADVCFENYIELM